MKLKPLLTGVLTLALLIFGSSAGLASDPLPTGQLLKFTLHGKSLENNLLGFSAEREVNVYLPPSYTNTPARRYPVLYILHGITDPLTVWTVPWSEAEVAFGSIQNLLDRGINAGLIREMILVLFDARTPFFGSHYVNSPVKGNWQDFITRDLISHIDSSYRTLPGRESRGVMGHSMGGYGALRLALDRPDLVSAVYGLSPSLLGWSGDLSTDNPAFTVLATVADPTGYIDADFYVGAAIGISQAFSPNPERPPLYADYPFALRNGALVPNQPAHDRWQANFLPNRIPAYLAQPVRLKGLRFDAGFDDQFTHIPPTARAFSRALQDTGVAHDFEMYNGDHRNRLWGERGRLYTEVLPFFSHLLAGDRRAEKMPGQNSGKF